MIRCIYGARFSMTADILQYVTTPPVDPDVTTPPGGWTNNQDPITGEIITDWEPGTVDNPTTTTIDESVVTVPCMAQGVFSSGIRAAGSDESFGDLYYNTEYIKMWLPPDVRITKRDRVTNIRDSRGDLVFLDEEYKDGTRSTVYNVQGVTPRFDYTNKLMDQFVLLEKTQ
jgi:hypothetical protein